MSEYIVEMYDECEKYFSEYGCKPTNTQGFPLREEIVRCRDCEYQGKPHKCWLGETKPDEFCSRSKRKECGDE